LVSVTLLSAPFFVSLLLIVPLTSYIIPLSINLSHPFQFIPWHMPGLKKKKRYMKALFPFVGKKFKNLGEYKSPGRHSQKIFGEPLT
jgi:hypothetical protein